MKSPAFTLSVIAVGWATFAHAVFNSTNFPTHAKRNRHLSGVVPISFIGTKSDEQRHRWTLDGIEFAASAIRQPPRNDRKAFTLTELLVTIVIILSITALLLPAVHNARNSAKALACSANLGRLCNAMLAYESMAETFPPGLEIGRLPPPTGGFPGSGVYDTAGWWWFNYIDVYKGGSPRTPTIVKCPAKYLPIRPLNLDILCSNFGANQSLCKILPEDRRDPEFLSPPLSRSDIRFPSETMLLVDSGYAVIKWHHASKDPPKAITAKRIRDAAYIPGLSINSQRPIFTGQEKDAIDGRHPGKTVNVGFVDGHVERVEAEKLLVDSKGNPAGNTNIRWKPK